MAGIFAFGLIVVAMIVIWRASDGFEVSSEYLGRNLSDGVRGATINAIGSSMPELFTTLFGLLLLGEVDNFAFGIGTTAGSAIFNSMIIPAVVIFAVIGFGIAKKVEVSKKVILRDGLSLIAAEFVLILFVSGSVLYWWHGVILMVTYGIYIIVMFSTMSEKQPENILEDDEIELDEVVERKPIFYSLIILDLENVFVRRNGINKTSAWTMIIVSVIFIGLACIGLVRGCEILAGEMGIAPYFIAVILASAATSVPDTILSFRDAMDGDYDDAVANALGSNIFDICFALGLPLFLYTIIYSPVKMSVETVQSVSELRISLILLTIIAFCLYYFNKGMGRLQAIVFISVYALFTFFVFARGYDVDWAIQMGQSMTTYFDNIRIALLGK